VRETPDNQGSFPDSADRRDRCGGDPQRPFFSRCDYGNGPALPLSTPMSAAEADAQKRVAHVG